MRVQLKTIGIAAITHNRYTTSSIPFVWQLLTPYFFGSIFSSTSNQKTMTINMLMDSLRCIDNEHMHETHQRCIFTKFCAMKMSPGISYAYLQSWTASTGQWQHLWEMLSHCIALVKSRGSHRSGVLESTSARFCVFGMCALCFFQIQSWSQKFIKN